MCDLCMNYIVCMFLVYRAHYIIITDNHTGKIETCHIGLAVSYSTQYSYNTGIGDRCLHVTTITQWLQSPLHQYTALHHLHLNPYNHKRAAIKRTSFFPS